jgi:hypothetical protein
LAGIFGDRAGLVALFTGVPKKLLCGRVAVLVFCDDTPNPPVVAPTALPKSAVPGLNGLRVAEPPKSPELELGLLEGDEAPKRLLPEADSWPPKPADALLEIAEACFGEPPNTVGGAPQKIPLGGSALRVVASAGALEAELLASELTYQPGSSF